MKILWADISNMVLLSKAEVFDCSAWPIPLGWNPCLTPSAILVANGDHFGFSGSTALQAMSNCPRRR